MFVLDTNTLIYFFRGDGRVAERLLATAPAQIVVPTIVVYELETGLAKSSDPSKRRGQLDQLLRVVSVVAFGVDEAKAAAALRARLEQSGTPIGPLDTLIAGCALALRATLVTRNAREFERVPDLRVADWYA